MRYMRRNILIWILPLLAAEVVSVSCDLILRGNTYLAVETLPLFAMLSFSASFIYLKGFKYTAASIYLGLIIGILKMNYIFFLEDLNGQGTMNGAYALFICLYKGILAGFILDVVFAISKRLVQLKIKHLNEM